MSISQRAFDEGPICRCGTRIARMIAFAVGLGAALVLPPAARAQLATSLPPNAIPLNIPGTYALPPPPPGSNPETMSAAELQAHGLPPMPNKLANPKAYSSWLNAVSIPKWIIPALEKTNIQSRPNRPAPTNVAPPMAAEQQTTESAATVLGSYNWSGYAVSDPSNPFTVEAVAGSLVVPVARNPFGQCPNHPLDDVYSVYWVGIDGLTNNSVFQGGVEADSVNDCAGSSQYYAAWFEWIPGPLIRVTNAPVEAGDYIYIQNWTTSSSTGCFFWANESQQWAGGACSSASALGGNPISGNSVEWVSERPYTGQHATGFAYLTNYVTAPWWQSYAWNYASSSPTFYFPGSAPSGTTYQIYAVDDSGGLISYPFLTGIDSIFFYDYGSAYCSPGASCTGRY